MEEFQIRILRHALDLETQYAKVFHYSRNGMRNHAEVFTTNQRRFYRAEARVEAETDGLDVMRGGG